MVPHCCFQDVELVEENQHIREEDKKIPLIDRHFLLLLKNVVECFGVIHIYFLRSSSHELAHRTMHWSQKWRNEPGFWQEVEGSEKICPMKTDVVILDSWDPGGGGPSDTLAVAFAGTSHSLNFPRTLL